MVQYFAADAERLVTVVVGNRSEPYFTELIQFAIPAVFGYFASGEFVDLALQFYSHAILRAPEEVLCPLLRPFFFGPVLFPFFEAVVQPFCEDAVRVDKCRDGVDIDILLDSISFRSPLIPSAPRELLRLLSLRCGYGVTCDFMGSLFEMFFQVFLGSSRVPFSSDAPELITAALCRNERYPAVIEACFDSSQPPMFEPPCIFDQYVFYLMCVRDAIILVDAAVLALPAFPGSLATMKTRLGPLALSEVFIFRTFRQPSVNPAAIPLFFDPASRLVFSPDPHFERCLTKYVGDVAVENYRAQKLIVELETDADFFECYLTNMSTLKTIKSWGRVVATFEHHVFLPLARIGITMSRRDAIDATFAMLPTPFPESRKLWREQFFAIAESMPLPPLSGVCSKWAAAMREFADSVDLQRMFPGATRASAFCACIATLRGIGAENLSGSFARAVTAVKIATAISPARASLVLRLAIAVAGDRGVLTFYVAMTRSIEGTACFEQLWSASNLMRWLTFQSVMLEAITATPAVSGAFFEAREANTSSLQ
jgi:hypothetical protein